MLFFLGGTKWLHFIWLPFSLPSIFLGGCCGLLFLKTINTVILFIAESKGTEELTASRSPQYFILYLFFCQQFCYTANAAIKKISSKPNYHRDISSPSHLKFSKLILSADVIPPPPPPSLLLLPSPPAFCHVWFGLLIFPISTHNLGEEIDWNTLMQYRTVIGNWFDTSYYKRLQNSCSDQSTPGPTCWASESICRNFFRFWLRCTIASEG